MDVRHPGCGEDVAPYALGALSDADARRFEQHLVECELCRADLQSLRPVVETLPETPEQVDPPADLRRRIMAVVEEEAAARQPERRRAAWAQWLRPAPVLALACALLLAGLGVGIALRGGGDATTLAPASAPEGVEAVLHVEDGSGRLELHGMDQPPEGRVMQVWLMHDGRPVATDALFTPNRSGDASVAVPGDLEGVERVLVSVEPAGGSRSPTTTPALDFELPSA